MKKTKDKRYRVSHVNGKNELVLNHLTGATGVDLYVRMVKLGGINKLTITRTK